jgi:hypothetical protein
MLDSDDCLHISDPDLLHEWHYIFLALQILIPLWIFLGSTFHGIGECDSTKVIDADYDLCVLLSIFSSFRSRCCLHYTTTACVQNLLVLGQLSQPTVYAIVSSRGPSVTGAEAPIAIRILRRVAR